MGCGDVGDEGLEDSSSGFVKRGGWGEGLVAAGGITETTGRAAERATKGDENFPRGGQLLSRHRDAENLQKSQNLRRSIMRNRNQSDNNHPF